jgi:hypothetical protein
MSSSCSCPKRTIRTTVFDPVTLIVDGVEYTDFEELVIEERMSKAGLSGIVHTELRVTIHDANFLADDNAEVSFHMNGFADYPSEFFINRREISGSTVKLTCRSKLFRLDCLADFTEQDFDNNGEIVFNTALARIAACAGLSGFSFRDGSVLSVIPKLHKNFLYKANCMSVIEKLSAALCGTFREYQNTLTFCPWEEVFMENVPVTPLAPIKKGLEKNVSRLVMNGGGQSFNFGSGGYTRTVRINTPFTSQNLANYVYARINNHKYQPYECKAARLTSFPLVGCTFNFDGLTDIEESTQLFYTNRIKMYPRRGGLFCECACNAVNEDEWDYDGEIERRVQEKIAAGERVGSTTLQPSGNITFESPARLADKNTGLSSELVIDDEDGFKIKSEKTVFEATESVKLTGERMDIQTPLINLPPEDLLTQSKDLIGALNELFTAGSEGGDLTIADLVAYDELYQACVKAHHAYEGSYSGYGYVMGFAFNNPVTVYDPGNYCGVRVIPNSYMDQTEGVSPMYDFEVTYHIWAGMDDVDYVETIKLTFSGNIGNDARDYQVTSISGGENSAGEQVWEINSVLPSPCNTIVCVVDNNVKITSYGAAVTGNNKPTAVWVIPPGFRYSTRIRRACFYPEGNGYSDHAAGLLMKDIMDNHAYGQIPSTFIYDIFGAGRETHMEWDYFPLFSTREIQYMIDKRNGIEHPTIPYM